MTDWKEIASVDQIDPEEPLIVASGETVLAIYAVDGDIFATAGICTHEAESLESGYVEDGTVECPYHSAVFNIKSGEHIEGPSCDALATYPVKCEGQTILVDLAGGKVAS